MAILWPRFYDIIRAIPYGRVATYGDVARMAGNPRAARDVGWALSALPKGSDVPWWRVVNRQGGLSCRSNGTVLQAELLTEEGIVFDAEGRLDLAAYRWDAEESVARL
jgi:methylated-DNA-protein-cysteine methyltransferase-like protein